MAAPYKRKRGDYALSDKGVTIYRAPQPYKKRKTTFVPGKDRASGYYGRYSGVNAELKFHDSQINATSVSTSGAITSTLCVIAQGTSESERIGRKCTIRSMHFRYAVKLPEISANLTPPPPDELRVIIYLDKQCNGAAAVPGDILEQVDVRGFRNLANSGRFVLLHDKMFTMNYETQSFEGTTNYCASGKKLVNHGFNKKVNIPIEYNSTTGGLSEIRSNNIGCLLVSDQGVTDFECRFRLRYSDA